MIKSWSLRGLQWYHTLWRTYPARNRRFMKRSTEVCESVGACLIQTWCKRSTHICMWTIYECVQTFAQSMYLCTHPMNIQRTLEYICSYQYTCSLKIYKAEIDFYMSLKNIVVPKNHENVEIRGGSRNFWKDWGAQSLFTDVKGKSLYFFSSHGGGVQIPCTIPPP